MASLGIPLPIIYGKFISKRELSTFISRHLAAKTDTLYENRPTDSKLHRALSLS